VPAAPDFVFDPFSREALEDPYPIYRRLLDEAAVYRNPDRDFWALTRYDDVQAAARDWETFSSGDGVDLSRSVGLAGPGGFLDMDPIRHDELRKVIREKFTPKAILGLEREVRTHVQGLIDDFIARGEADFAADLARALPLRMICSLLGFPMQDDPPLQGWFEAMVRRVPGRAEVPQEARDAAAAMRHYIDSAAAGRAGGDGGDVLTALVAAENAGEISPQERTGMCVLLFLAGISTAAGLISTGLWLLHLHSDQRAALVRDPGLIPDAVEELVRYVSPVQALARTTTREVDLHGERVPKDARVLLVFGAANRDPRRFERPDVLDVQRARARHLGFGEGIHFCLGAPLARLQARVVLEELLSAMPWYEVAGDVRWMTTPGDRGLDCLPVRVT
jgi:cytochrome P450